MDQLPECTWDAECGLIVLYRRNEAPDRRHDLFPDFQLVIELSGGNAYYAGELPADRAIWVVRAPRQGQFRLLFYPPGSPGLLDREPVTAIAFDDRLQPELDRSIGEQHQLSVWLFTTVEDSDGTRRPEPEQVLLEPGKTLEESLADHDWRVGDPDGLTVHRVDGDGDGVDAPRGPASHPFRNLAQEIDVRFTLVPDNGEVPEDLVILDGFDELSVPAIVVDLTAFGDHAESERESFHFIHRPHGEDIEPGHIRGADVDLLDHDGRRYLYWPCDRACHLDFLGVYHVGGKVLQPHGDEDAHVYITGEERLEPSSALIGMFYGDVYQMRPMNRMELDWLEKKAGVAGRAMVGPQIQRNAAWAAIEERWANIDLRGADKALAFTLTAYAELLELLLDVAATEKGDELPALLDQHGILYRRFSELEGRADLLYALVCEPRLAHLLHDGRLRADVLMDARHWSPSASLAAALEPGDTELARWVDTESPAVQRALWLFMLAGGEASVWRDLAVPVEAADGDLVELVQRLREARAAPLPRFLGPTAADLGLDPRVLDGPPRTFADAMARVDAIATVKSALDAELEAVNSALHGDLEDLRLDRDVLADAFASALDLGQVPTVDILKQKVKMHCVPLGSAASDLVPLLMALKTRIVLWGLVKVLADARGADSDVGEVERPFASPKFVDPAMPDDSAVAGHSAVSADPDVLAYAGPRVTDPAVPLRWLLGFVDQGAFAYPPPAADADGEEVEDLLSRADELLEDVEHLWGLLHGEEPQPLPQWTDARAAARERTDAAFSRGCRQARRDLDAMGNGTYRDLDAIKALWTRVERVRDYIVADCVWADAKQRASETSAASGHPGLAALYDNMRVSPSGNWDGLAAELDRMAVAHDPSAGEQLHRQGHG